MYLRNHKDPRFKLGGLSAQWLLKHSVCIRAAKSEHWTPSSPLPWDFAFHLNSLSNYYSALQSISAIYHSLLAHLHKKNGPACTNHQNGRRTDSEECSKGRAIQNSTWKRGTHAHKTHTSRARQNVCKRVKKSFIIYFAVCKLFQITLQCLER